MKNIGPGTIVKGVSRETLKDSIVLSTASYCHGADYSFGEWLPVWQPKANTPLFIEPYRCEASPSKRRLTPKKLLSVRRQAFDAINKLYIDNYPSVPLSNHFYIGTDPEFFLAKDGVIVPAWQVLLTRNKLEISAPFWDGVQGELVTLPRTCCEILIGDIRERMMYLTSRYGAYNQIVFKDVIEVPEDILRTGTHEQVRLGCSPSYNIYGLPPFINHKDPYTLTTRTAGFHMHFSMQPSDKEWLVRSELAEKYTTALDRFVGVASVALLAGLEDPRRRRYYGRPGEIRYTYTKLEYRPLSSVVLSHPTLVYLMFDMARFIIMLTQHGVGEVFDITNKDVIEIMMDYDVDRARKHIEKHENIYRTFSRAVYGEEATPSVMDILLNGVKKYKPNILEEGIQTWLQRYDGWLYFGESVHVKRLFPEWVKGVQHTKAATTC